MAMTTHLRSMLSQYRKRKQHGVSGTVPGVSPNHFHRGYRPATAPIDTTARGGAPQDYLGFQPRGYDPLPGEPAFPVAEYAAYQPHTFREAATMRPVFGHAAEIESSLLGMARPPIDTELAEDLLRHFVNEAADRRASGTIPIDNEVWLHDSVDPTRTGPSARPSPIPQLWVNCHARPAYGELQMTNDEFTQAMDDVGGNIPGLASDPDGEHAFPTGHGLGYDSAGGMQYGLEPGSQAALDLETVGFLPSDVESSGMPGVAAHDPEALAGAELEGMIEACGMPGSLEQMLGPISPVDPEPDPLADPEDDLLFMDPWGIPGMGPGFGPMGPLGPIM